jgi:hypothetical protein
MEEDLTKLTHMNCLATESKWPKATRQRARAKTAHPHCVPVGPPRRAAFPDRPPSIGSNRVHGFHATHVSRPSCRPYP